MPAKTTKPYVLSAFDPGERTGFVTVGVELDFRPSDGRGFTILDQGVLSMTDLWARIERIVKRSNLVAYETWRLYADYAEAMIGNDMQPSQAVGVIRYVTATNNTAIVSNGASIKKVALATMPEWLVEHMSLSSEQHDQDAIMHGWFVAVRRYYKERE